MKSNPERAFSDLNAIKEVGRWLSKCGIAGAKTPEEGAIIAFKCRSDSIDPVEFGNRYHLIKGKVTYRADYMLGLFRQYEGDYEIVALTETKCTLRFFWKSKEEEMTYTIQDAKKAGIYKGTWERYTKDMLFAGCVRQLRKIAPEIFHGQYLTEELAPEEITSENKEDESQPSQPNPTYDLLPKDWTCEDGSIIPKGTEFSDIPVPELEKIKRRFQDHYDKKRRVNTKLYIDEIEKALFQYTLEDIKTWSFKQAVEKIKDEDWKDWRVDILEHIAQINEDLSDYDMDLIHDVYAAITILSPDDLSSKVEKFAKKLKDFIESQDFEDEEDDKGQTELKEPTDMF